MIVDFEQQDIIIQMAPEGQDGQSVRPVGEWSANEQYRTLDLVSYQGESYIALKTVPVGTLPTNTAYWMINASNKTVYWGTIEGTLADQEDLKDALDAKADADTVYTKTEADALLAEKADADEVYTKAETDALLDAKANEDDVYTKSETIDLLAEKADADSVYTKTETDNLLDLKANAADVYTQAELDGIFDGIDNALDTKADASNVYTKTQTDNKLAEKANADSVYTKGEVDTLLTNKADANDVYTKTETDNLLSAKANTADLGTLAEKDSVDYETEVTNKPTLGTMAAESASDYYTKTAADSLLSEKADIIHTSASGTLIHLTDAGAYPVDSLSVGIEPVQDLHGYDAPWLAGGGVNLLPKGTNREATGITFTVQDNGEVVVTGTATALTFWAVQFTLPAGTYILNGCPSGGGTSSYTIDIRNALGGSGIPGISGDSGSGSTFTLTESLTAYVNIRIANGYACPSGGIKLSPMIRLSSVSDATYAPYSNICPISGHTEAHIYHEVEYDADADPKITVDLDGTRYGGQLNVLTGELTVTHGIITASDMSDAYWGPTTGGLYYAQKNISLVADSQGISSMLEQKSVNSAWVSTTECFAIESTRIRVYTKETTYASFAVTFADLQIVYPLATPLTVQLSPATLSTLLGENNLWADTGQTAVGYRADTKRYIDQQISERDLAIKSIMTNVEAEMKATKNYTSGQVVIVGDSFYKLTANVSSGSALTVGSNCVKTDMATWILSIV